MELRLATTEDILEELMRRPLRFVFFGNETTNSPRPRLYCGAGKLASPEEYEELVDQARDWLEAAVQSVKSNEGAETTFEVLSGNEDESAGSDALRVRELLASSADVPVLLVSDDAIVAMRTLLTELGVADVKSVRIRWTEEGAELVIDEHRSEDIVLEHEGRTLLVMDSLSLRACAGRVLHYDASEECFVWVRTDDP